MIKKTNISSKIYRKPLLGAISLFMAMIAFSLIFIYFSQLGLGYEGNNKIIENAFILSIVFSTLGIAFAVVGLFKKNCKKTLSIIALLTNLLIILIPLLFYLLLFAHEVSESGWDKFIP